MSATLLNNSAIISRTLATHRDPIRLWDNNQDTRPKTEHLKRIMETMLQDPNYLDSAGYMHIIGDMDAIHSELRNELIPALPNTPDPDPAASLAHITPRNKSAANEPEFTHHFWSDYERFTDRVLSTPTFTTHCLPGTVLQMRAQYPVGYTDHNGDSRYFIPDLVLALPPPPGSHGSPDSIAAVMEFKHGRLPFHLICNVHDAFFRAGGTAYACLSESTNTKRSISYNYSFTTSEQQFRDEIQHITTDDTHIHTLLYHVLDLIIQNAATAYGAGCRRALLGCGDRFHAAGPGPTQYQGEHRFQAITYTPTSGVDAGGAPLPLSGSSSSMIGVALGQAFVKVRDRALANDHLCTPAAPAVAPPAPDQDTHPGLVEALAATALGAEPGAQPSSLVWAQLQSDSGSYVSDQQDATYIQPSDTATSSTGSMSIDISPSP